jgi:hypothetical protein
LGAKARGYYAAVVVRYTLEVGWNDVWHDAGVQEAEKLPEVGEKITLETGSSVVEVIEIVRRRGDLVLVRAVGSDS